MAENITLDELRMLAGRAGLSLSEEELKGMIPALSRSRLQVVQLRELMSDALEPAGHFSALRGK